MQKCSSNVIVVFKFRQSLFITMEFLVASPVQRPQHEILGMKRTTYKSTPLAMNALLSDSPHEHENTSPAPVSKARIKSPTTEGSSRFSVLLLFSDVFMSP